MFTHHEEAIERLVAHFRRDPAIEAVLLVGSIAHGFETSGSDIDVALLVSHQRYQELSRQRTLTVSSPELCGYPGGYVDGKYVDLAFLEEIAARGSEPARFAFQGARVLFSRIDSIEDILRRIVRYPVDGMDERMRRFSAQLEAWNWYVSEASKRGNSYLGWLSVGKLVLFGGRLILVHNQLLYPYHKWFLRVLAAAREAPVGLMDRIDRLYQQADAESVQLFYESIRSFRDWGLARTEWPTQFMKDSELNWRHGATPVDDL